ncbi:MAG: hypothetical protein AAFP86_06720 [Planctomycetota bacterium]
MPDRTASGSAAGPTRRAFADDGCTYVPFLGSSAPRNFPVRFELVTAEVDGVALELEPAPRVVRDGERVVIERGPVRAIYDVALESIEQSFALHAAGTSGDAVLRLGVETEFAVRRDGEGLRFGNELGAVLYSGAVALDGAGRRVSVPVESGRGASRSACRVRSWPARRARSSSIRSCPRTP